MKEFDLVIIKHLGKKGIIKLGPLHKQFYNSTCLVMTEDKSLVACLEDDLEYLKLEDSEGVSG